MARPDYVHCVLTGRYVKPKPNPMPETKTWCGRDAVMEFAFVDASHAALNARNEGRLLICPECSKEIRETLEKGTWYEEPDEECEEHGR